MNREEWLEQEQERLMLLIQALEQLLHPLQEKLTMIEEEMFCE